MHRAPCVVSAFGLILGGAALHLSGCFFSTPINCDNALVDCPASGPTSSSGGGSGHGGGSTSSSSSSGGTPVGCVPSTSDKPVEDTCGIFVSSSKGQDGNEGTKSAPLQSLQQAIDKADGRPIYACAEAFAGSVTLAKGSAIYGGLDCAQEWTYVGATTKTSLTGDADKPALTIAKGAGGAAVEDLAIQAANAVADGGSSIAVVVNGVGAGFARCALVAGNGKAGLPGGTPTDPVGPNDANDPALKGNDGRTACLSPSQQFGGEAKENTFCPADSGGPLGGSGGVGAVNNGSSGDVQPPENDQTALGGLGQPTSNPSWSCATGSGLGNGGKNGPSGGAGEGAIGTSALGTIDSNGYVGAAGQPGGAGVPGQGGGGGGGAKGKASCAGASGGSGGAGGCGGKGGGGGAAGGASIGLLSLNATLTLSAVTIQVGLGGSGGDGGLGQAGGSGGNGGNGGNGNATSNACNGGKGGQGGFGGRGGGGRGGHAIGIAYNGAEMPASEGVAFTKGTPGVGGKGVDGAHSGDPGVQADLQAFP